MTDDDLIYAPFAGIIPTPFYAGEVAAPPYDVLSSAEAKVRALGNAYSFLHISKAEIDFPGDVSPYEDRVYGRAADNFRRLLAEGVLPAGRQTLLLYIPDGHGLPYPDRAGRRCLGQSL